MSGTPELQDHFKQVVKDVFGLDVESIHIEHPENPDFDDLATNISMVLAPQLKQDPLEIAKKLVYKLKENPLMFKLNGEMRPVFEKVEFAPPGFINLRFANEWLNSVLFNVTLGEKNYGAGDSWYEKKVLVEYTDPNPFKLFHVGHVMTNTIGESLARIFEFLGAKVKRVNYQGDVGIHVANSIWGLNKKMIKDNITLVDLKKMELEKRMEYLGQAYTLGVENYEKDEESKKEMQAINNHIYIIAQNILSENESWEKRVDYENLAQEADSPVSIEALISLYKAGKKWSLDHFEKMYKKLDTNFDYYYFESQAGEMGWQLVMDHIEDGVFIKDQGAIIFKGEEHGLHTRVFINSKGLPVYEAKDLGLAVMKANDFAYDKSLIVTGNEVDEYFKVVFKALEQFEPELAAKTTHIGHGMMVFNDGKMSSRTGDVVPAEQLLQVVKQKVLEKMSQSDNVVLEGNMLNETAEKVALASVKYSILKSGIGHDIVYDEEEATNLLGNTGPYLQYTYARTCSVMEKAGIKGKNSNGLLDYEVNTEAGDKFSQEELDVLRHIYKFPFIVQSAGERMAPNLIAGFVHELAQKYNTFYAKQPILNAPDPRQKKFRLHLTQAVGQVIHNGLDLLGIPIVDKM